MTYNDGTVAESERSRILRMKSRRVMFLAAMAAAILLMMGYSFTVGTSSLSPSDAYRILLNQIMPGRFGDFPEQYVFIVTQLRAPRVLVGCLAGAILAMGGCFMQSLMKNPLATPYTLGVSSSAATGATLYFIFGISVFGGTAGLMANAFVFALLPVLFMMLIMARRRIQPTTMILSGVAFSYVFSSINSISQYFGDDSAVANVVFWTIGDLTSSQLWMVLPLGVGVLMYLAYAIVFGKDMDIMRMGDDTAASLGVDVRSITVSALMMVCFVTAVTVACCGPIGFICLLAPHICRRLVGTDLRWLVPTSACFGAILLLVADLIAKTAIAPQMLPVGAITALLGAPVMVYLLYSKRALKG